MKTIQIRLNSIEDVNNFNHIVENFPYDFDLLSGRYVVDAKSIMGIFSLDLKEPINLNIYASDANLDEVLKALKPFTI